MALVVFSGAQQEIAGVAQVEIAASRVDELVRELAARYPGLAEEFETSAVAINDVIHGEAEYLGLPEHCEVCFVPRVAAG